MTVYASGTKFEYLVRDYYKKNGFQVMRSAGSKGAVDLIAWNMYGDVMLIQCKKEKKKRGLYTEDVTALQEVPAHPSWNTLLWIKTKKIVKIKDILNNTEKIKELKELR